MLSIKAILILSPKFWIRQWKTNAFTKRKYEISAEENSINKNIVVVHIVYVIPIYGENKMEFL